MMREIAEIIKIIKQDGAEKIILFGSRVYGKAGEDSDFDLAVIKKTSLPYHQRLKNLRRLIRTTTPLDLFVFTPKEFRELKKENPLISEIVSRGRVLYAK